MIRWVYIAEIVVSSILLEITKDIQFLTRKFWRNNYCASFPFYFLYIFFVNENLVSKYEQLLILMDIAISTLLLAQVFGEIELVKVTLSTC